MGLGRRVDDARGSGDGAQAGHCEEGGQRCLVMSVGGTHCLVVEGGEEKKGEKRMLFLDLDNAEKVTLL